MASIKRMENSIAAPEAPAGKERGLRSAEARRRLALVAKPALALLALAASALAVWLGFPREGDLGVFALGVAAAALLLRGRPSLLGLFLAPALAAAAWSRLRTGLAADYVAAGEALLLVLAAWAVAYRIKVARAESQRSMSAMEATISELRAISIRDPLTSLYNRRFAVEAGRGFAAQAKRYGSDLHILMLDLDHFKKVNDSYGHAVGDEVLKGLAEILRSIVRQSDVAARIGGEEFVVLLTHTGVEGAYNIANRIRDTVAATDFPGVPRKVTVSLGVAGLHEGETFEEALARADVYLYQSKHSGRNRVTVG